MKYISDEGISLDHTVGSSSLCPLSGQARGLGMPRYHSAVGGFQDMKLWRTLYGAGGVLGSCGSNLNL